MASPLDVFPSEEPKRSRSALTVRTSIQHVRAAIAPSGASVVTHAGTLARQSAAGLDRWRDERLATATDARPHASIDTTAPASRALRPAPASYDDRIKIVAIAAATSAAVSLLTTWISTPAPVGMTVAPVSAASAPVSAVTPVPGVIEGATMFAALTDVAPLADAVAQAAPTTVPADAAPMPQVPAVVPQAPAVVARRPPAPASLRLTIISQPSGARVTVDGVGWGTTPLTIRNLPPGRKHVRVTKAGFTSEERVVTLGATQMTPTIRLELREAGTPSAARQRAARQ